MKKSSFITAIMAAMIMIAPSKMSAQEDNGFKKFSVEEAFEDNGFQWFRDAQLLCAGNKEKSNAAALGECIWNLAYDEKRSSIVLELSVTLEEDTISDLCCQFPIPADYDGVGLQP